MSGSTASKKTAIRLGSMSNPLRANSAAVAKTRKLTKAIAKATDKYNRNVWLFAYIALLTVATQIAFRLQPTTGIFIDTFSFAALLGLALYSKAARTLAISAAIIPIVNIIGLCIPQNNFFDSSVIYYSTILLFALMYRFIFTLEEPIETIALKRKYFYGLPLMIFIGELLGVLGYLGLRHHYLFKGTSLPLVAVAVVVFAIAEEMYFRGLIQYLSSKLMHPLLSISLTVALYTLSSVDHQIFFNVAFALVAGTFLSITYYKKQNLVLTIALNSMIKLTYVGLVATFILKR